VYRARSEAEALAALQPDDAAAAEIREAVDEIVPWRNPESLSKR